MANTKYTYYCERCGAEMAHGSYGQFRLRRVFILRTGDHETFNLRDHYTGLCYDCVDSFKKWFKDGSIKKCGVEKKL